MCKLAPMLDRAHFKFVVFAILAGSTAIAACTKSEAPSAEPASSAPPSPKPKDTAAPPAPASAAAAAGGATAASAATAPDGAAPKAIATADAGADLTAANAACGKKPLPDCPLQAWMKANTNAAISANDFPALVVALDKTATMAPPGYANWVSIAKDGAKAAKAGDLTATKASCRTCHDQYKRKYKEELRGQKI